MQRSPSPRNKGNLSNSFIKIEDDETLYSWCGVNHLQSCNRSSAASSIALLGAAHAMRQHEIPQAAAKIPIFEDELNFLGLLRRHTIAGFYLPFRNCDELHKIAKYSAQKNSQHWARSLMGVSRTMTALHPLKWCKECFKEDIEEKGRAYWHVVHQFPTSLVCHLHGEPLSIHSNSGKHWHLPHRETYVAAALPPNLHSSAFILAKLGACLQQVDAIEVDTLRKSTLHRLQKLGIIHSVRGARHDRLARWFANSDAAKICRILQPDLAKLHDGEVIAHLFWHQKINNAVCWIFLWSALNWESPEFAINVFFEAVYGLYKFDFGQIPLFDKDSAPQVSTPINVRAAFEKYDSYAEIMRSLGARRSDIIRWLDNDPELRSNWRSRLRQEKQKACIEYIRSYSISHGIFCLSFIEKGCQAEFRWLREHAPYAIKSLVKSFPKRGSDQKTIFDQPSL